MKRVSLLQSRIYFKVTGLFLSEMLQNRRLQVARFSMFTLFVPLSADLRQLPRFHPACNTM